MKTMRSSQINLDFENTKVGKRGVALWRLLGTQGLGSMLPWIPPSPQSLSAFIAINVSSIQPFNFTQTIFPQSFFSVWKTSTSHLEEKVLPTGSYKYNHRKCDTTTVMGVPLRVWAHSLRERAVGLEGVQTHPSVSPSGSIYFCIKVLCSFHSFKLLTISPWALPLSKKATMAQALVLSLRPHQHMLKT